jgi:acetyl-CoA carboxylase biotin carboxylase subunit
VEWQLRIAANQGLAGLGEIKAQGHAIECRINAEDVLRGFQPCPGTVTRLVIPSIEGLRVDTHLKQGDRISPHYDSMFAKLIARGSDRKQALARMLRALEGLEIDGVPSTREVHIEVLKHPDFVAGQYHTGLLEQNLESILAGMEGS